MSRIEDLLDRLCPGGVEFKELSEIAELVRGNGMPKSDFVKEGVGCIHYGQIYTHYGTWATEVISYVAPEKAAKLAQVDPGDLIVTNTSENLEDVGKAVAWLGNDTIVTGGHATVVKPAVDPKYLAYWFQSPAFRDEKRRRATGTKVIDVSAKQLARVRVPVAPREVQLEIVRVLDQFTQLEAELEAELQARRRQYHYYRQVTLAGAFSGTIHKTLGRLGRIVTGRTPKASDFAAWGNYMDFVTPSDIKEGLRSISGTSRQLSKSGASTMTRSHIPAGSLLVTCIGADMGKTVINASACATNQQINAIIPESDIDINFMFHVLTSMRGQLLKRGEQGGGTMPLINKTDFSRIEVAIPSLHVQRAVAERLDLFDSLVSDLSVGLPAELTARRKQYEHYRDRLLTFDEAAT